MPVPTLGPGRYGSMRLAVATVAVGVVLSLFLAGCAGSPVEPTALPRTAGTATAPAKVELPGPGGTSAVETVALHLVDEGRNDPLDPDHGPRELMIQLWYPARGDSQAPAVAYLDPGVAKAHEQWMNLPEGTLQAIQAHAGSGGPVAAGKHPVVVFSPGYGVVRGFGTTLLEDLASRGYVVAAMDHTYDAAMVQFPDGRLVEGIEEDPDDIPEDAMKSLAGWDPVIAPQLAPRVADTAFVLDTLQELADGKTPDVEGAGLPEGLAEGLDVSRIGMLGHSLGGSTTAQTVAEDARVKAGFVMDGYLPKKAREQGTDRPLLLMQSSDPQIQALNDQSWAAAKSLGWHRTLQLQDSGHNTFTDQSILCDRLGKHCDQGIRAQLGAIDADQALAAQRAYIAAFFDQHLRGTQQPLLDNPSNEYPQVKLRK